MRPLTRGEVARRAGIGVETVRFYEEEGLIHEPPRSDSGYRQYPPSVVARIGFIRRAKELGFQLKEIADLLALRVDAKMTCAEVKNRASAKMVEVQEKIRDLERIRSALDDLVSACHGSGPTSECPILEALEQTPFEVQPKELKKDEKATND